MEEDDIPHTEPPILDGDENASPTKLQLQDDKKEAIDSPLIQKNPLIREESSWLDLRWAISWIQMLHLELNGSFVFGVMVVYGFGQGVGGAINRVVVDYYWKDVELAQPSAVQLYRGFSAIPWDVKPVWGLMTDILPIGGYLRRPYFLITGILTVVGSMVLTTGGRLWVPMAVGMLVLLAACAALSDATIDAEVTKKSREKPSLAADIQSLCAISISVGSLVGFAFSGLSVEVLGAQGAIGLMLIPACLLLILGFVLHEECDAKKWHASEFGQQLWSVTEQLCLTLKQPRVWKPTLYMYICIAVSPDLSEGKFYWYTSAVNGPGFSEEFVWAIYAAGSVLSRLKWMSLLILAAKLCPPGIEGIFFSFLMSVDNVGMLTSSWLGAALLQVWQGMLKVFLRRSLSLGW